MGMNINTVLSINIISNICQKRSKVTCSSDKVTPNLNELVSYKSF